MDFLHRRILEHLRKLEGMHLRTPASLPRTCAASPATPFCSARRRGAPLDRTVADPSIAAITFSSSSTSFTIAAGSGGVLHLANGGSGGRITVSSGSHTISVPVELDSNLTVLPAAGSQLTISGGITCAAVLTVDDRGKVILSGTNGYTGGTAVSAGTLIVSSALAIPCKLQPHSRCRCEPVFRFGHSIFGRNGSLLDRRLGGGDRWRRHSGKNCREDCQEPG